MALTEIRFESGAPSSVAFALNNALYSAQEFKHEKYESLRGKWKVTHDDKGVIVKYKPPSTLPTTTFPHDDSLDVLDLIMKFGGKGIGLHFPYLTALDDLVEALKPYEYEFTKRNGLLVKGMKPNDG